MYFDRVYIDFSRPLANESIQFSNFTIVTIPGLDTNFTLEDPVNENGTVVRHDKANLFLPYDYIITQISNLTVEVKFTFKTTVKDQIAKFNISDPSKVVDKYNWSLIGSVK